MIIVIFLMLSLVYSECDNEVCEISDYDMPINCPNDCLQLTPYIEDIMVDSYPFTVPINISGNAAYYGVDIIIEFDADIISFESLILNGTILEGYNPSFLEESGMINMAIYTGSDISSDTLGGTIANLIFDYADDINTPVISFINILQMKINGFNVQCDSNNQDCLDNQNAIVEIEGCGNSYPICECGLELDACGICGGPGAIYDCGCNPLPVNACDCDGNIDLGCGCGLPSPSGCDNMCGSTSIIDCNNECGGSAVFDECGVCNGNGPLENYDCFGNCLVEIDCNDECGGSAIIDECGICNGNNLNCIGCTDQDAINFNEDAIVNSGCEYEFDIEMYPNTQMTGNEVVNFQAQIGGNSFYMDILPFTQFTAEGNQTIGETLSISIISAPSTEGMTSILGDDLEFSTELISISPFNITTEPGIYIGIEYESSQRESQVDGIQYQLYKYNEMNDEWVVHDPLNLCEEGSCVTLINSFGMYAVLNTIILGPSNILPIENNLLINYPNPFNPSTTFSFNILHPGYAKLAIFNTNGEHVKEIFSKYYSIGTYDVIWNAESNSSGVYFAILETADFIETKKIILLK